MDVSTIIGLAFICVVGIAAVLGMYLKKDGGGNGNGGSTTPDNDSPIAYPPFVIKESFDKGEHCSYDLRYRQHGCNASGGPTSVTGAWDPNGDTLKYRITCEYSVFDSDNNYINGVWHEFRRDDRGEQLALIHLWIGWRKTAPRLPIGPMGCTPTPQPTPLTYEVKDEHGAIASRTIILG